MPAVLPDSREYLARDVRQNFCVARQTPIFKILKHAKSKRQHQPKMNAKNERENAKRHDAHPCS